ncbi:hypothetical protein MP228_008681 [Amoeboaphelidium protococcarum]|nr:hypothetical protein MP228_008681 [Amoeboaphelidium protococcarum]
MSSIKTNLHQKAITEVTVIQDPALNQHQTLAPAPLSITKSQIVVKQQWQQQTNQHNLSPTSPLNSSSSSGNFSPNAREKDSIEEAYKRFVRQRQEAMDRLERERQELKQRLQQKRGLNMLTPSKIDISRSSPSNQQDTTTNNYNNSSNGDGFSRSGAQSAGNRGRSDQRNQQNLDYREFEQGLPPRNPWDIEENDFDQLKQIYK